MQVVVTGGSGFIGHEVVKQLDKMHHNPVVVDRSVGLDIMDKETHRLIEEAGGVIHLAGVLGTEELFETPYEAVDVNVKGTIAVLDACRENGTQYVGITMPQVWDNIYQATKLAAGRIASAYYRHYDVPVSHVRAYNVYGVGQKHGPGHPQKMVPTFAFNAWRGLPLPVWGDGTQQVDLIHVSDVAAVLVDALKFGDNRTFDAGTGIGMSVNTAAGTIKSLTGHKSEIEYLPMRKGEHGQGVVAKGEGWDLLGYRPDFKWQEFKETVESYKPE